MNFDQAIKTINKLLAKKKPGSFNSSWILKYAPRCYRFVHRNIRTEFGGIDWDKVTYALEWKYQRRWAPGRPKKNPIPYENPAEVDSIINKNKEKLYVFIAPQDLADRRIRDIISISLVRLSQNGNLAAKQEVQGYEEEIQKQLEGCIRRYRYTGSFLNYVFRILEYAGRGIRPFYAYSLDEPIFDGTKRKIDNVSYDSS